MTGTTEGGKKTSEGGRGNPEKASPAAVERYIKGIHFPAQKKDLIHQATSNGAPEDVMHVIHLFDEKKSFQSAIDIAKEVGRVL